MTKASLARAKSRMEKAQRKNVVSRKEAASRGDTKTELSLAEKIEDYNTILWALEVGSYCWPAVFRARSMTEGMKKGGEAVGH